MDTKKKSILIGVIVALGVIGITVGILAISGVFKPFDAKTYVEGTLNHWLKGDVKTVEEMTDGVTGDALYAQYEAGVTSFVENNVIVGVEMDETLKGQYVETCKKVFSAMKYEVKEPKETEDGFEVAVTYQPTDIFTKFAEAAATESQRLNEKANNSGYKADTYDNMVAQMQKEFLDNSYVLFQDCYKNMQCGEEQTMVFKVTKGEDGVHKISGEQITEFITKIMGLDANQD